MPSRTYLISYHDAAGQQFVARIEALNWADAERHLLGLQSNAEVLGELVHEDETAGRGKVPGFGRA